jgi:hypothetical protein
MKLFVDSHDLVRAKLIKDAALAKLNLSIAQTGSGKKASPAGDRIDYAAVRPAAGHVEKHVARPLRPDGQRGEGVAAADVKLPEPPAPVARIPASALKPPPADKPRSPPVLPPVGSASPASPAPVAPDPSRPPKRGRPVNLALAAGRDGARSDGEDEKATEPADGSKPRRSDWPHVPKKQRDEDDAAPAERRRRGRWHGRLPID